MPVPQKVEKTRVSVILAHLLLGNLVMGPWFKLESSLSVKGAVGQRSQASILWLVDPMNGSQR